MNQLLKLESETLGLVLIILGSFGYELGHLLDALFDGRVYLEVDGFVHFLESVMSQLEVVFGLLIYLIDLSNGCHHFGKRRIIGDEILFHLLE